LESRSPFAPEYSADPETAILVFDELWKAAGDDYKKQYLVFMKMLRWLLLELKETSKCGRMFLKAVPNYYREALSDGANLVEPYKKFHELYLLRVLHWLPKAVRISHRGYGKFDLRADAILDLVIELSDSAEQWAMSVSGMVQILDRLDIAAEILEEALRDSTPTPTDKPDAGGKDSGAGPAVGDATAPPQRESDRQLVGTLRDRLELILAVFDKDNPGPFRAKEIAKRSGLHYDSHLRSDLSQLKQLKFLNKDGRGYTRTDNPYPMS
jgi:hypothetical protein